MISRPWPGEGWESLEILRLTISQRLQDLLSGNLGKNSLYLKTSSATYEFILDFLFLFLITLTQLVHNTLGTSER